MSEAKHTPGPWGVRKWHNPMRITGNVHKVTDSEGYPCAFVPAWDAPLEGQIDGTEEAKANARLIAAAPYLLEALERCLNFIENTEGEMGETLSCGEYARAAIAKAKGEE